MEADHEQVRIRHRQDPRKSRYLGSVDADEHEAVLLEHAQCPLAIALLGEPHWRTELDRDPVVGQPLAQRLNLLAVVAARREPARILEQDRPEPPRLVQGPERRLEAAPGLR